MDLGLKDKRALVIGASHGLGYAAALGLASEGARVAIVSRSPEGIQKAAAAIQNETHTQVIPLVGDVADPATPDKIVRQASDGLGGLDILITNAGGPPSGKFERFADDVWQQAVEFSFLSHVRLIRAALPYLRQSTTPSVLAVASYSVKQPIPGLVLSNSVRAATTGLIKTLAIEMGSEGIRFNAILPGWTETEHVKYFLQGRADANHTSFEEEVRKQTSEIPLGRMARPREFANAAVFLVSPAASYVDGVMLTVDGGLTKSTL
jgi:3-oxoacyl-[acyl-carrier protein] reductase